jgi:HEAT repeat protein
LERFSEKEDIELFVELLASHREPSMRDFAARRLGKLGGPKAIAALKGALVEDEQMQTRVVAAATLAALGQKDGHKLLLESFASLDMTRNIALGAIEYMDQDQVCARMIELLKAIETFESDNERQRFLFGYAWGDLFRYLNKMPAHKLEPAIPTLKSLLKYPDDSISRRSGTLLKKLGVALEWKYDIGQKRGWYEVMPTAGAKQAGRASVATAKKSPVRLSSAAHRTAQDELNAARQLSWKYWAIRENAPHDSQSALASFEKAVSAFRAVSEKYAGTDIDAQAKIGLYKLFHLAADKKQSGRIIDALLTGFGAERVSDAYFELGLDYLQRAHDPRRALAMFAKIPMPPAPDASDKSDKGLQNYELVRSTYAKVQQPMAKCEVQLGELGKAEKRYARLIELFPELTESFQRSLEFEVRIIATRRPRNKYWLSLTGLKQKLYQRRAARWLEDSRRRQERAEQQRWGKEAGGLQCSIGIEPAKLRVGDSLAIQVEIKNVSADDICLHYQNLYQAGKLTIKNERGGTVPSMQTVRYNWPHPKEFFHVIKADQTFTEQIKGRVEMKFIRAQDAPADLTAHPLQIDFHDVAQQIEQSGRFTATLRLIADEKTVSTGTQFGFNRIWTGELVSNGIEFSVRRMRRDELDKVIAQLRTGSDEEKAEAIEVIKANKDRQAVRELMSLLTSRKGPLRAVSDTLVRIQDTSILPDLLDLYRISARYGTNGRGEFQRTLLQTISGLESDRRKIDALFIEVVKSNALVDARQYAASHLGSRDDPQVVAALFEAAGKEPPQVQWAAIDALGWIGSRREVADKKEIIEPMAEILKTAPNSKVRRRAASALGRVGSGLVVPSLIEALEDEDLFVGASAAHYLGRYAGPEAVAPLEKYVSRAETDSQKRAAGDAIKYIRQRAASKE